MAKAVAFREFTPRNSRDDLLRELEQASIEHAEAVLAGYDLLQRLHEKGLIDLLNGLLSAGDTIVDRVVDVISSKEMVTALRIALILGDLLSSIDADKLRTRGLKLTQRSAFVANDWQTGNLKRRAPQHGGSRRSFERCR
jgi:uncharacterized protein YjgD (DUF1641 family)